MIKKDRLQPILKWAGGKEQELKYIHSCLPKKIYNYYEPFVGGGSVYLSMNAEKMFINDKYNELIALYKAIASENIDFFYITEEIIKNWDILKKIVYDNELDFLETYRKFSENIFSERKVKDFITSFVLRHGNEFNGMFDINFNINIDNFIKEIVKNVNNKIKRMKAIEIKKGKLPEHDILDNIECAFKSAFYMHFRHLYNNLEKYNIVGGFAVAIFFFIRNFAYSGMFRYNKKGEFNVPYGGIGYNRKNLSKKINYLRSNKLVEYLNRTVIDNLDFEVFFDKNKPQKNDFIFLDPPYDSEFSTYAKNEFTKNDQIRLSNYLIDSCRANWMMIIKNTDFIYDLYNKKGVYIEAFEKKYLVNFQNRNNQKTEHLLITNYNN